MSLLINAFMLWITTLITNQSWFSDQPNWGLEVTGGFWWFVLAALVISVVQTVLPGGPAQQGHRLTRSAR